MKTLWSSIRYTGGVKVVLKNILQIICWEIFDYWVIWCPVGFVASAIFLKGICYRRWGSFKGCPPNVIIIN